MNFCSKTVRCNAIAQKFHKGINYQPIQFWNVSIHPIEHIEVNNYFSNLSFSELGLLKSTMMAIYFAKLQGHNELLNTAVYAYKDVMTF